MRPTSVAVTFRCKLSKQGGQVPDWFPVDPGRRWVSLPALRSTHIDKDAARRSERFGAYANSDLLVPLLVRGMVASGAAKRMSDGTIRVWLDHEAVTVDESGFLAVITVAVNAEGSVTSAASRL